MQRLKLTECEHYFLVFAKIKGQILVLWCKAIELQETESVLTVPWVISWKNRRRWKIVTVEWHRGVSIRAVRTALGRHWGALARKCNSPGCAGLGKQCWACRHCAMKTSVPYYPIIRRFWVLDHRESSGTTAAFKETLKKHGEKTPGWPISGLKGLISFSENRNIYIYIYGKINLHSICTALWFVCYSVFRYLFTGRQKWKDGEVSFHSDDR